MDPGKVFSFYLNLSKIFYSLFSYLQLEVAVMYQDTANKEYLNLLIHLKFQEKIFNRI